ncbi:la-related protein 6 [Orussus abietinus]|uniref:la-related protein 6 n=1 Tax=Orussus abietinus TaxID=222816 RepID=UPI0006257FB1|nr:la-related protein 6 [Orussus abietinus]
MEELEVQQELRDQVGSLTFSPPPMKKSDTRDSISSVDSDVSLSFDRRGSKGEEADLSDCGSSDCEGKASEILGRSLKHSNDSGANSFDDIVPRESSTPIATFSLEKSAVSETTSSGAAGAIDTSSNTALGDFVPPSDELADRICAQVEFYFSDENIVKDAFLLKHVKRNKEGYVSLKLISSFKRIKHLSRDWRVVGIALKRSKKIEVNELGTKLRRVDPLPPFDQTTPSRTVLAAKLPLEKLSVESVAEIFSQCGEISLIRVLKPGHPIPAEIRQAIAKRPELTSSENCALVEFTDSASARAALQLKLGEAKIYELHHSGEKKRKASPAKKSAVARLAAEETYNSSSCASGSETEDARTRHKKPMYGHPIYHVYPGQSFPGPPSPEAWLSRRLSSCSLSSSDNGFFLRRLSSCSSSGSGSEGNGYTRRFSACSSSSDNGYYHPIYPPGYYSPTRRFSCCSGPGSSSGSGNECISAMYSPVRRGSAECGPFLRRLSGCSRDSGFEISPRRLSSCSSGSETGFCRPRSNSGIVMAHLPENVTRMPSGPDGTRGFGRLKLNSIATSVEPTC